MEKQREDSCLLRRCSVSSGEYLFTFQKSLDPQNFGNHLPV